MPRFRTPAVAVAGLVALATAGLLYVRQDAPPLVPGDLPSADRQLVEFLLLLPVAALVCCVVRNVIGLHTYGTFAPALLGLAFRDVPSPLGLFLLVTVLSVGWVLRRGVARLNLLQVPRGAVMLTVVAGLLAAFILVSNHRGRPVAQAIPFLPMVIVTGLIERFWTTEEEDGSPAALRAMGNTLVTAFAVFAVVRVGVVHRTMIDRPEALGFVAAGLVLIGRYTGYRLTELARFRSLAEAS
ncbi:MAG TPA: 7TM domain-containing protein [Gemmataceae bacterium]|nr:7TM domain-containing protein [Gemmataceae bacterium]